MATPSKAQRAAHKRAAYLRKNAQEAATRKGGWRMEGDARKGIKLHLGIA